MNFQYGSYSMEKKCFQSVEIIKTGPMVGVSDRSDHKDIPSTPPIMAELQYVLLRRITSRIQHPRSENVAGKYSVFGGDGYALYLREGTRHNSYFLTAYAISILASICLQKIAVGQGDPLIILEPKTPAQALYTIRIVMLHLLAMSAEDLYKFKTFQDRWMSLLIHSLITVFFYWLEYDSGAVISWHIVSSYAFSLFLFELAAQSIGQHFPWISVLIHLLISVPFYWPGRHLGAIAFSYIGSCFGLGAFFFELAVHWSGQHSPIYVDWKEIRFPYFRQDKGVKQL